MQMRRDVKIGIAVGLCVIALAVLYFVFAGGTGRPTDEQGTPAEEEQPEDDSNIVRVRQPRLEPEIIRPRVTPRSTPPEPEVEEPATQPPDESETQPTEPTRTTPRVVRPYTPPRLTPAEPERPGPPERASEQPVRVTRPQPSRPRLYTVQEGDDGFWAVSQKVYGHGKYWQLIADANPTADSNALRAGQTLRVPALPEEERQPPSGREPTPGSTRDLAGGRRIYTVQKGDNGFWGVSQKVYGTGRYARLIAEANPQADSSSLRPGQTLIIPPRPSEADRPVPVRTTRPAIGSGERTYTVQEGDKGFWGVAEKVYGDGTYWTLIQRANPGVDSSSLHAGDTLIVPPRSEARRRTVSRQPDRQDREAESPARPVFD
jgi:nucleoid-associated protein YgaU